MKSRRTGYTMVELLVCLAIVSLLAGVVYPLGVKQMARAKEARCIANLKQIGMAMTMYYNDWDRYPATLDVLRESYRMSDDVFVCPSDPTRGERQGGDLLAGHDRPLSYLSMAFLSPVVQPEHDIFYGMWLPKDPLAGPLVVCMHHSPPRAGIHQLRDLGVYGDGHVALCKHYVRDYGAVTTVAWWPFQGL
jgi:prepilin-type N-terminal cleavage/methylation domain-containing protein